MFIAIPQKKLFVAKVGQPGPADCAMIEQSGRCFMADFYA
jgi:hypothetical protein